MKKIISLFLSIMMVCTLLPTAAFAEDSVETGKTQMKTMAVDEGENTPSTTSELAASSDSKARISESIPITIKVYDKHSNKEYKVGSVSAKFTDGQYQYILPDLTAFVPENTFGSLSTIKGDEKGDHKVGDTARWMDGTTSGYITYYVDWYTPAENTNDTAWRYNFKLTYDGNGENVSGVPAAQVYRTNKIEEKTHAFTIPSTAPACDGYNFKGWQTEDGSTTYQPGASVTLASPFASAGSLTISETLTAVWEYAVPDAPTKQDVLGAGIKVTIECDNAVVGHSSEDFDLTEAAITNISEPSRSAYGTYSCDVTISLGTYVPQFNAHNGGVEHTPAKETKSISLTYNGEKWVALAIDTGFPRVAFTVHCDAKPVHTVTYTDGVDNEEIFKDQTYTVETGKATPAFNGTPTRDGYKFTGWSPAVTDTVTGNVTYTAQWEKLTPAEKYTVTYTDGVDGEEVFKDQTYTVETGKAPPAFNGTPTRKGYTFAGWKPAVAATVTGNATYEATWKSNSTTTTPSGNKPSTGETTNPQTGDTSNMLLWIALLFISGGAAIGTTVVSRKKKYNR